MEKRTSLGVISTALPNIADAVEYLKLIQLPSQVCSHLPSAEKFQRKFQTAHQLFRLKEVD